MPLINSVFKEVLVSEGRKGSVYKGSKLNTCSDWLYTCRHPVI